MAKSYLESLLGGHEKIILVTRQHWFILARSIFLEISIILVLLAIAVVAAVSFPLTAVFVVVAVFLFLLVPIFTMTRDILNWSHRQYIVTNRRVIQISGVFNKSVTDSNLEKVNDLKLQQSALGRIFDYGDIEILTASEIGINLFKQIEDPVRFKTAMINAKEMIDTGDMVSPIKAGDSDPITAMIASLSTLNKNGVISDEEFKQKKAELLSRL
jgi:membrane protein YdbS with pleckstrin-like domain